MLSAYSIEGIRGISAVVKIDGPFIKGGGSVTRAAISWRDATGRRKEWLTEAPSRLDASALVEQALRALLAGEPLPAPIVMF